MKRVIGVIALTVLVCSLSASAFAGKTKVIEKTFDAVESLKIKTVLGDCIIKKTSGDKINIRVEHDYDDDEFEAKFKERGNSLYIEEDLDGEDIDGDSEWFIEVPEGVEIEFKSATGGLKATGLSGDPEGKSGTGSFVISDFNGELEIDSGTGDISLSDAKGDFQLETGTGEVSIENAEGEFAAKSGTGDVSVEKASGDFEVKSGTGHVDASDLSLESFGEFKSGTGNAKIDLPEGYSYELEVASGTGNATIECGGADLDAKVEMTARKRGGKISSSFDFEDEEEFYRGDDKYVRKWFTKGSGSRTIEVRTGTGRAKLKK